MKKIICVLLSATLLLGSISIVSADAISKNFGYVSGTSGCFRTYGSGSTTRGNGAVSLDFYNQLPGGGGDVYQKSSSSTYNVSISVTSGRVGFKSYTVHGGISAYNITSFNYDYLF